MRIIGHGVDIVETARIERMLQQHGERFLDRCFTPAEQAYGGDNQRRQVERLAVRFAAKESVLKAIGTGWRGGIEWTDVEVVREPSGQPIIHVSGKTAEIAESLGVTRWLVSLSHTERYGVASVIACGED